MPSLINRVPLGLLGLLGIKALGKNPSFLQDTVQPTVDLSNLYVHSNLELLEALTGNVNAVGVFTSGGVQNLSGEFWVFPRVCIRGATLGAATTYRLRLGLQDINLGLVVASSPNAASGATGERIYLGWEGPIIVPPGYALTILCEQYAGVAQPFTISGLLCRADA